MGGEVALTSTQRRTVRALYEVGQPLHCVEGAWWYMYDPEDTTIALWKAKSDTVDALIGAALVRIVSDRRVVQHGPTQRCIVLTERGANLAPDLLDDPTLDWTITGY